MKPYLKLLVCSVILGSIFSCFAFTPKKAEALDFIVYDPFNFAVNSITSTAASTIAANTTVANTKEFSLDTIAWIAAKLLIRQIVNSTVTWINSGFNGNPSFISNPSQFFGSFADKLAGDFIYHELGTIGQFICSPFDLQLRLALQLAFGANFGLGAGGGGSDYQSSCSLTGIISNVKHAKLGIDASVDINASMQGFVNGDFDQGGWDTWFAMTQTPKGNVYGAFQEESNALSIRISAAIAEQLQELGWGNGFLSFKDKDGNITTPGDVIQSQLNNALGSDIASLVSADEFNEILGALAGQLLKSVLGGGGLASVSSSGGFIDQTGYGTGTGQDVINAQGGPKAPTQVQCKPGDSINVALGMRASQMNSGDSVDAGPDAVVDGQKETSLSTYGVAIIYGTNPWWQVDLGKSRAVDSIRIYKRNGDQEKRDISNFYVFVSDTPFTTADTDPDVLAAKPGVYHVFVTQPSGVPIDVPVGGVGQYVRIQQKSNTAGDPRGLQLIEVEVYSKATAQDCPNAGGNTDTTGGTTPPTTGGTTGGTDTGSTGNGAQPGPSPAPQTIPATAKLITNFGAIANDGKDDSAAIIAAANAAGPGGVVGIKGNPGDVFEIQGGPTLPSNVQYLGQHVALKGSSASGPMFSIKGDNVTIKGIDFQGGGIFIDKPNGGGNNNIDISWNDFHLNVPNGDRKNAITFTSGLNNSVISNNYFNGYTGGFGIYADATESGLTIANNECVNVGACMHINSGNSSNILVENNYITGAKGMGMEFQGKITNGTFKNNWYEHPNLSSTHDVNGNSFAFSLPLDKGENITISHNGVYAPERPDGTGTRVAFEVGSKNTLISDNYVDYVNRPILASGCGVPASITVDGNHIENWLGTMIEKNFCFASAGGTVNDKGNNGADHTVSWQSMAIGVNSRVTVTTNH